MQAQAREMAAIPGMVFEVVLKASGFMVVFSWWFHGMIHWESTRKDGDVADVHSHFKGIPRWLRTKLEHPIFMNDN